MLAGLRLELTKGRLTLLLAGGGLLGVFGIYFFLYHPLIRQLKIQGAAAKATESELAQARSLIERAKNRGERRALIKEEEVSRSIDELTRVGKLKGVDFISMTPRASEKSSDSRFQILPLEIEIESTYEALGLFLGSLDELLGSLVTVASFKGVPAEGDPSKLRTQLILHIYLVLP